MIAIHAQYKPEGVLLPHAEWVALLLYLGKTLDIEVIPPGKETK